MQVRHRKFNKANLEYFSGRSRDIVDQACFRRDPPTEVEQALANEVFFYREWLEHVFEEFNDFKNELEVDNPYRHEMFSSRSAVEYGRELSEYKHLKDKDRDSKLG